MPGSTCGGEGEGFPKSMRLRERRQFLRAKARGRKVQSSHLIALAMPGIPDQRRLGITVSARVGNSVERNQVKRWIREIFRKECRLVAPGTDLVLIARTGAPTQGLASLRAQFLEICAKLARPAPPPSSQPRSGQRRPSQVRSSRSHAAPARPSETESPEVDRPEASSASRDPQGPTRRSRS